MAKSIFKSKTFWANIIAGIAVAIPGLQLPIGMKAQVWILVGMNIVLRTITTEPVKLR